MRERKYNGIVATANRWRDDTNMWDQSVNIIVWLYFVILDVEVCFVVILKLYVV